MAIISVFETDSYAGTINDSYSFSAQHNFGSPLDVWSRPYLQSFWANDDNASVELWVSQFKDNQGTHNGQVQTRYFRAEVQERHLCHAHHRLHRDRGAYHGNLRLGK